MFIGLKKIKKSSSKEKIFYLFFIPLYKKLISSNLKKISVCGLCVYKNKNSSVIVDYGIDKIIEMLKISDIHTDINLVLNSISANLRDLKRFENKLIKKFPELKE